jgi:sulfite reductase (NADPH) flavoprotein alpha-component
VIDIVERFPVPGIDAETLLAALRSLQPRLYSIASGPTAAPDEAHLTVSTVRYDLNGRPRTGAASGYLARRTGDGDAVPVYVQASPHFHLPDDGTPILMVGAGTGVAPYRAFMQEREARGAKGRSWLLFGERNFRTDFLYQIEWQALLRAKVLTRMDVAFSRDGAAKTYDRNYRAVTPPIYLSSTFALQGYERGGPYAYTRTCNPMRDLLAETLAQLEDGAGAVVATRWLRPR